MSLTIPPLQKLVRLYYAKFFWNLSFKPEDLRLNELENEEEDIWEIRLISYREKAICNLNAFLVNREYLKFLEPLLNDSIFLLYKSYYQLVLWKIRYDSDCKIDLLQDGELYAPNYFTVDGEFNDLAWTKRFVLNSNYPMARRFSLASFYWFQTEMVTLWAELVNLEYIPFEDGFDYLGRFKNNFQEFKILAYQLKSQLVIEESIGEHIFFELFKVSAAKGFEHAVYTLWQNMSETDKTNIMDMNLDFQYINGSTYYPSSKISHFLYDQLSVQRKKEFFQWSIDNKISDVWFTLLLPPLKKVDPEEYELIYKLPINMFTEILLSLSHRISRRELPDDGKTFKVLWSKLSSEKIQEVLESSRLIIHMVEDKSLYYVGYIIKRLSLEQKDYLLYTRSYERSVFICLDNLCKESEFYLLQKYLSFFLFKINSVTQKEIMCKDAIALLQKFIKSRKFKRWYERLSASKQKEVKDQVDALERSATLLCEKISEEISISPTS